MIKYNDYLKCFIHLMKHVNPRDVIWEGFAKILTNNLQPFTEEEFKKGGKVLRNNIREYYEVFYDIYDR